MYTGSAAVALVNSNNLLALATGGQFLYTIFDQPDGIYYDAVGDEIFTVQKIGTRPLGPVYRIDFGDEVKVGHIQEHGFHTRLGDL